MQSSGLLCGPQPRPAIDDSGDLPTEIGLGCVPDLFLKTFTEDVKDVLLFVFHFYKSKYFGCCGLEKAQFYTI